MFGKRYVALMTVLIFCAPFVTLAEQHSTPHEGEAAVTEDINAIAEQDANRDINKLLWFGAGVGIAVVGSTVCAIGGCLIGQAIDPTEPTGFYITSNPGGEAGFLVGAVAGNLIPLIGIYSYKSSPPPERFIGKSAEYVESYARTYRAKTRSIRTKWAVAGTATGLAIGALSILSP